MYRRFIFNFIGFLKYSSTANFSIRVLLSGSILDTKYMILIIFGFLILSVWLTEKLRKEMSRTFSSLSSILCNLVSLSSSSSRLVYLVAEKFKVNGSVALRSVRHYPKKNHLLLQITRHNIGKCSSRYNYCNYYKYFYATAILLSIQNMLKQQRNRRPTIQITLN